ncbi:hemolysin type calcium binding protein [Gluconacetobacter diazotrophicus]|nr:hemolysin type calcium binding protein [Gluconacetobacter diazotrophicus]
MRTKPRRIDGNGDADEIIYNKGYGDLVIGGVRDGTLKLGPGLDETSLWLKGDTNNALEIDVLGTSDKIEINGWFNNGASSSLSEIVGATEWKQMAR